MLLTPASVILSHLVKRSETWISSYSQLRIEAEVDGVKRGKVTETISDVSDTCIRDVEAPSREK